MRFLLLNQTFPPDVMATGQYLADLALALIERGHEVTVVTSRRAYDDPQKLFPKEETWHGIRILRIGSTAFGKTAKWRRAADFGSFLSLCVLKLLLLPRHDVVLALTSPPLISFIGAWLAKLRGSRFVYWVMDFNPDEAIAAGWLRPGSLAARVLEAMSRFSLRRAARVIALDRFMRGRILEKGIAPEKVLIVPPWSHDDRVRFDPEGRKRFRDAHRLNGKFVVMYSGNHSPCHPLDTLLQAARRLAGDSELVFCFVGGGSEWRKICAERTTTDGHELTRIEQDLIVAGSGREAMHESPIASPSPIPPSFHPSIDPSIHQSTTPSIPPRILCLPYQPLDELSASLSAADLHVVVMGDPFVGLVHPCKIYNILAVGAPVLYIGPVPSHVTEICGAPEHSASEAGAPVRPNGGSDGAEGVRGPDLPCMAFGRHGDVAGVVEAIQRLRKNAKHLDRGSIKNLGRPFGREVLLPRLIETFEGSAAGEAL